MGQHGLQGGAKCKLGIPAHEVMNKGGSASRVPDNKYWMLNLLI